MGCEQSGADQALYVLTRYGHFLFVMVCVDDILLLVDAEQAFEMILNHFRDHFDIRADRITDKFLGFSV